MNFQQVASHHTIRSNRLSSGDGTSGSIGFIGYITVSVTTRPRTDRFHRKMHGSRALSLPSLPPRGRESDESVDRAEAENRGYILGEKREGNPEIPGSV